MIRKTLFFFGAFGIMTFSLYACRNLEDEYRARRDNLRVGSSSIKLNLQEFSPDVGISGFERSLVPDHECLERCVAKLFPKS
ncbi:hypothetical protein B0H11DRAFT_1960728, partial [Mycena galericulata]